MVTFDTASTGHSLIQDQETGTDVGSFPENVVFVCSVSGVIRGMFGALS